MKKQSVLSFCGVVLFALSVCGAGPWYVAKEDPNASDDNPGTEALPFRTIQAAIDNKGFEEGDTVYVKRGVYDEGMKVSTFAKYNMTNRVYIAKTVHLLAVDGKDVTSIVGYASPGDSTGDGLGEDSIRCVGIAAAAKGTVLDGFTFRGGRTTRTSESNRAYRRGGGVYYDGTDCDVKVVGCDFRDCRGAYGGAAFGITAIRCLVDDCRGSVGAAFNGGIAYACVISCCTRYVSVYGTPEAIFGASNVSLSLVNCTIFGNTVMQLFQTAGKMGVGLTTTVANCVIAGNANEGAKGASVSDSTTSAVSEGKYQVFAPGFEDYRLVENATAIGLGKVANVQELRKLGLDEDYLKKDFLGNDVDLTKDTLNAGAVQLVATAAATAMIAFDADTSVDGRLVPAGFWVCSEAFPVQHLVEPIVPEGQSFYAYARTSTGSSGREPTWVFLQPNGTVRITPPPASALKVQTYTPHYAAAEIWSDPTAASGGDGSAEAPFRTLQDAADAVAVDYTIIRAKKGDYKEGGKTWSNLTARVDFYSGREDSQPHILLRSEEGPEETAIWGAAASVTEDANEPGCGTDAVRCVLAGRWTAIQGFTLRDGHTFPSSAETVGGDTADYRKNGAAVYSLYGGTSTQPYHLIDCVITNCVGAKSIVFWGFSQRNKFVGNTTSGAIEHRGYHSSELILNNICGTFGTDNGWYFFSTFVGNAKSAGADEFVNFYKGESVYGSIVIGGRCARTMAADIGNFYWEQGTYVCLSADSTIADPLLADVANGDCRPYVYSPVIGACPSDNPFYLYAGSDLNCGPLAIAADGKLSAGCFQGGLPTSAVFTDRAGGASTNAVEMGGVVARVISSDKAASVWSKGTVTLREGYAFEVEWAGIGGSHSVNASVSGTGTLTAYVNGVELGSVTEADGVKSLAYTPSDAGDTVRFVLSGEGTALLADFRSGAGLMLILR